MLPCNLFEKTFGEKCTNPQVCLICSLSHKRTWTCSNRVSLNSPPPPPPEHTDLIISILLCVVLSCCLSNYNASTVDERCWFPLHSLAAAILSGYSSVGIWQTEIPLHTPVKDQTAFLELQCFPAIRERKVWNTSRTTAIHTDCLDACRTLFKDRRSFSLPPHSALPLS